ncbi:Hypothetical predicted protein [Mytilus galloprovincialis]|uniref:Uncharacterized protein n=1 Tax=Mytilus galloprovincialis TaxID=29158 RepID=A0A8B6FSA3_MYTGA|nr:Hypothetical predicted protein [Mytilus galloprovincialis]
MINDYERKGFINEEWTCSQGNRTLKTVVSTSRGHLTDIMSNFSKMTNLLTVLDTIWSQENVLILMENAVKTCVLAFHLEISSREFSPSSASTRLRTFHAG